MNTSSKRASIAFAFVIILSAVVVHMFWRSQSHEELPALVSTALSRIESLPIDIRQRDIFPLLGLSRADVTKLDYSYQDGKSGLTWTRYQLGSTEFVLECESRVKPVGLEVGVESGVLESALIRRRVYNSNQEDQYVDLMPSWPKKNEPARQPIARDVPAYLRK